MSAISPLLERNATYVDGFADGDAPPAPAHPVVVVCCMDHRLVPAKFLGLDVGDAIVIRNMGGRVTDAVIHDIAYLDHLTSTFFGDAAPAITIAIVHHTGCGSGMLADADFASAFADRIGGDRERLGRLAVIDAAASVREDLEILAADGRVPATATVAGFVYDIETGALEEVVDGVSLAASAPALG